MSVVGAFRASPNPLDSLRSPIIRPRLSADPLGQPALRAPGNLLNRINLICPVQSCLQKYFHSRLTQITSISPPFRPTEGRIAIVTDAGRNAVDAAASGACGDRRAGSHRPVSGRRARGRQTLFAYGKAVWSWHPLLVSSSRRQAGPTGPGETLIHERR